MERCFSLDTWRRKESFCKCEIRYLDAILYLLIFRTTGSEERATVIICKIMKQERNRRGRSFASAAALRFTCKVHNRVEWTPLRHNNEIETHRNAERRY